MVRLKFVCIFVLLAVWSCLFHSISNLLYWKRSKDLQFDFAASSESIHRSLRPESLSPPDSVHSAPKPRYMSYETFGGWNNQRIILENAIFFSKLLNRTLIVHPLKPHHQSKSVHHNIKLSKVINLTKLRNLIDVIEETGPQSEFKARYSNLTWKTICRITKLGFWVGDWLPKSYTKEWKMLLHKATITNVLLTKLWNHCKDDLTKKRSKLEIWGILDDLLQREEEMIYFSSGSLYLDDIYFTSKSSALTARAWIRDYFTYADEIERTATRIANSIGTQFNAIHVRRTDYLKRVSLGPDHWLSLLEEQHALNISNILYVATDEGNHTWFEPFRQKGYSLLFSNNFTGDINFSGLHDTSVSDYVALHEQLICTKAKIFAKSYYSTVSRLISRLRVKIYNLSDSLSSPNYTPKWIGAIQAFKLPLRNSRLAIGKA